MKLPYMILFSVLTLFILLVPVQRAWASDIAYLETVYDTDFATAGVAGLRGIGSGDITLSGFSGSVTRAYLYWSVLSNDTDPTVAADVFVNGFPVSGTNIGFSSDNCWGWDHSQAYRADVTDQVIATGNGTYALTGFASGGSADSNGASLVVFFDDGDSSNDRDIVVFEGNDSNISNTYDADGWNVILAGIEYASGSASLQLHVGDGQPFVDDALVLNLSILEATGQIFSGDSVPSANNGELWDIKSWDVTSFLSAGPNTLELTSGQASDCLGLIVAVIDLPAGAAPPPPPPPVDGFVVYALHSCSIKGAEVTGDVGSRDMAFENWLHQNYETHICYDATIFGNVFGDSVKTSAFAYVSGDVHYNDAKFSSKSLIDGDLYNPLDLPVDDPSPSFPKFTPGVDDIYVPGAAMQSLPAGDYGMVELAKSKNKSMPTTLTLEGGVYNFKSLTLGRQSRLECLAPCEIRIADNLSAMKKAYIGPALVPGDDAIGAADIDIYVEGEDFDPLANSIAAVILGTKTETRAHIYAPNGTIMIGGWRVYAAGVFIGKWVRIFGSSTSVMLETETSEAPF